MNHRSNALIKRTGLVASGNLAWVSLLLGCNAILGIQKAESNGGSGGECKLDLDEELVEGCIFRASCDPGSPPFNVSFCVTYGSQAAFPEEEGTLNASSCAPIEENIGRRYEPPSTCSGAATGWSCSANGEIAQYCGEGRPFSWDCGKRGSVCTVEASARSGAYPCGIPDHISCSASESSSTFCEGSLQLGCAEGRPVGYDCDATDTECFETKDGATCLPDGGSCATLDEVTCQAESGVDYCAAPGVLIHYQCAQGTTCGEGDRGVDCYVDDCAPQAGCKEGCANDGVTVEFCVAGAKVTRKCTDYGFDYCSSYASGNGTPYAYCMMEAGKAFPGTTADWSEEPGGTGGSDPGGGSGGTNPGGTGGQPSTDECESLGALGSCTSVEACESADETECYYLVNGETKVEEDCEYPGPGQDQVALLCGL